jgi:DNA mismatch endonuclease (patch repair protein)
LTSKHTAPEMALRRCLAQLGLRYRLHQRKLPGTPDIVFYGAKVAVFVHGCFWHRHAPCPRERQHTQLSRQWLERLNSAVRRDGAVRSALEKEGWAVVVAWECEIRKNPMRDALAIERTVRSRQR